MHGSISGFGRRNFLFGAVAAIFAFASDILFGGSRRMLHLPGAKGARIYPRQTARLLGIPETGGTLLVTEGGRGESAPYGFRLNPAAAHIWRLVDGRHSLEDIADSVARRFHIPYDAALEDARSFIDLLDAKGFSRSQLGSAQGAEQTCKHTG